MANYPTSLDVLSNPTSSDALSAVSHSSQHGALNDIVEALEAKVGILASTWADGNWFIASSSAGGTRWTKNVAVACTNSGDFSFTTAAAGVVTTWDTELFDTAGMHSTSANTSRFTAPQPGYYMAKAHISVEPCTASPAGEFQMFWKKTGSTFGKTNYITVSTGAAWGGDAVTGTTMNTGDYLELFVSNACSTTMTSYYAGCTILVARIA